MIGGNGAGAFNAAVRTGEPRHVSRAAREQRAADLAAAASAIREQITAVEADTTAPERWRSSRVAALRAAHKSATAEAEQARREAQEGAQ